MKKEFIDQLIMIEKDRAKTLHPEWPDDIIHAAAIVAEESGELLKACLDLVYFGGSTRDIRNEAVSVAAMAERFLEHFPEYYSYTQAREHLNRYLKKEMEKDPRLKRGNPNEKRGS